MPTRKHPLHAVPQAPVPQTPRRYAPSTPHAIRATQQRSGAAQRSARRKVTQRSSLPRPDSAGGIFRRLAKLEAPVTKKRVATPVGKENVAIDADGPENGVYDEEAEEELQRPAFTLPILGEDSEYEALGNDEGDDVLDEAPIPSELPGGEFEYDSTVTFKSIDFASRGTQSARRELKRPSVSRISMRADNEEENEEDITVEIGRRAVSEGPSRISFGSIGMSGFEIDIGDGSGGNPRTKVSRPQWGYQDIPLDSNDYVEVDQDGHIDQLERPQRSMSNRDNNDLTIADIGNPVDQDEDAFNLHLSHMPHHDTLGAQVLDHEPFLANDHETPAFDGDEPRDGARESASPGVEWPERMRNATPIEKAVPRPTRRRRAKLTCHGNVVPSLPSSLIKRIAAASLSRVSKRKSKIDRNSLKALEQATEWFFEQVGEDLEAYSNHAGRRKRVDPSDVLTLMRRQRVIGRGTCLQDLASEHLPAEMLAELELPDDG